jgi:hypothetical protein
LNRTAVVLAALLTASCGGRRETLITYFSGEHGLSLRHPAGWRGDQAMREGVWYRHFAPPGPKGSTPEVFATLLVAPATPLEDHASRYTAGHQVDSSAPEERQGAKGRTWTFVAPGGAVRHHLLLLRDEGRVVGLHLQGERAAFERERQVLDEMAASLSLERARLYPERRWDEFGVRLRVPASWRETRRFSGGGTLLAQFLSPALGAEQGRETAHAALTLTVEPVSGGGGLEAYYEATRARLGENFAVVSHREWNGGYADIMRTETSLAVSYVKRYYRAHGGRGCFLSLDAREDVFVRASAWADTIASSLELDAAGGGQP